MNSNTVQKAIIAVWVPGANEYIIRTFSQVNFYTIPLEGKLPLLNGETIDIIKDYMYMVADPTIAAHLIPFMPKLKWIQCISAGVDGFFDNINRDRIPKNLIFTRMIGIYGKIMAEYVISQIIGNERHYFKMHDNQLQHKWSKNGWGYRIMSDLTIGLMGFGDIGKTVAELCMVFGSKIVVLVRSDRPTENKFCYDITFTKDLPVFLSHCDYIISILPSTPLTKGMLNGGILSHAKAKKPTFINLGRGDIVSEDEIIRAIDENWISGAILDVFEEEPLTPTSKLWDMPQIAKVFQENLSRYEQNQPLLGLVDFDKQY
ncbi:glyoxylate/hydroxypyruvate reductase A-like isoform X2 [Gordionus sp. m RMFG-2023]|uniref:glyoxylate/hydroxypyruvate reductase A-like isoform X2 n=1 Tax=Gordionus sp. m RMFG-2023 TaxID=3053472 RepID=UPI0031FD89FD